MTLDIFVSKQEQETIAGIRQQKQDLIAQMPNAQLRAILKQNFDLPLDKIAEIFTAMAKDYLVVNKDGYDFTTRSGRTKKEHKFSTLAHRKSRRSNSTSHTAKISNLLSKECDLIVLVDMGGYLKYFEFPLAVWKARWPNKQAQLSFSKHYWKKWYSKYEVSKEKFFSGQSVWKV
jgi:hypothetical protein